MPTETLSKSIGCLPVPGTSPQPSLPSAENVLRLNEDCSKRIFELVIKLSARLEAVLSSSSEDQIEDASRAEIEAKSPLAERLGGLHVQQHLTEVALLRLLGKIDI